MDRSGPSGLAPRDIRESRRAAFRNDRDLAALARLGLFVRDPQAAQLLRRPRDFFVAFAADHGVNLEANDLGRVPATLKLTDAGIELAARILVDSGRSDFDSLGGRASWCLPPALQLELCTPPPRGHCLAPIAAVAAGADPRRALAERQKWATYETRWSVHCRRVTGSAWKHPDESILRDVREPELSFDDPVALVELRELDALRRAPASQVDPGDPTLGALTAFTEIANLRSSCETDRANWMARWAFRNDPAAASIAQALTDLRWYLELLATDEAASRITDLSERLRAQFLVDTALEQCDPADLYLRGLGPTPETGNPGDRIPPLSVAEAIDVALDGQMLAMEEALRIAGHDAERWPWVQRLREALLEARRAPDLSAKQRQDAGKRLDALHRALVFGLGQGQTPCEARAAAGRVRPHLVAYIRAIKRGEATAFPRELRDEGLDEGIVRDYEARFSAARAADKLLKEHYGLESERAPRRAAAAARRPAAPGRKVTRKRKGFRGQS